MVLLDLASDLSAATELVRFVATLTPPVQVVGLHTHNDPAAILQSLRAGAIEFLYAPFDLATQREADRTAAADVQPRSPRRIRKRVTWWRFASSKPGSGASTIATQTAFSLQRLTGKRVLLADFDLTGGTIGFYLKLSHNYSLVDALQHAEHLDLALWNSLTVNYGGVDILPAPAAPYADPLDSARLRVLIDHARQHVRLGDSGSAGGVQPHQPDGDFRMRTGLSGVDIGAAQPASDAQGDDLVDQLGFPQRPVSACW